MTVKTIISEGFILATACMLQAQQVTIDSLDGNGQLTVNAPSNAIITVEWTHSLTSEVWRESWLELQDVQCTNDTITVDVPMFYRVTCWTNGLLAQSPIGRTLVYSVTNAYGEEWAEDFSLIGYAPLPALSNNYYIFTRVQYWDGEMPAGAMADPEVGFARPTDESLFTLFPELILQEFEMWRRAEVGTTWTNYPGLGDTITTIEAYEDVTVPAGVFTNCIRYHSRPYGETNMNSGTRFWIKPGFMEIKSEEYSDADAPPDATPIVRVLQSWSDD